MASVVLRELYRRKDFYVLFFLTALITGVMGLGNFFSDDRTIRYLKELCLLLIWLSSIFIALSTTARQIPTEREQRTLLPLLAKPISRSEVVGGKFLGCWLACGLTLVLFYLFFGFVAMAKEHTWPWANYLQAMWLHWMLLGIVVAMTLLGSVVFAAPSQPLPSDWS